MVRLVRWRMAFAVAVVALAMVASPNAAQDVGTVTAASPEATVAAIPAETSAPPAATEATPIATTATPAATEAAATSPPATEAPTSTEAATATPPASTPAAATTEAETVTAATEAPVSTGTPTTSTTAPSATPVPAETSATILQESTSSQSLRGGEAESSAGASSLSSASKSASDATTGTLDGSSSTKTAVVCLLAAVGLTIISSLVFVVWRSRRPEDPDLDTPLPPDTATITFPAVSMPSIVAPTAQDMSAWKASGSSFASRDLPLTESTRAKLNATTRSSTEYDLSNSRPSQIASLSARGVSTHTPQADRETNASSEQSFSIRGYSEFSVHHAGDSETSAMTNDRYSTSDGYDRYSTNGRYSTSSRLSSEPGRSNSGWFPHQVPKNLDMHRFSSTSSTASAVARKHNPVSFINHDLTLTPSAGAPVTTDSTTSRTDVPDWYSVIESPTDNDRYTTSSLDSDTISDERESFEL